MTTDPIRVELKFSNDPRLLRAVLGAIAQVAERAGLDVDAQQNLVVAVEQACADTFKLIPANDGILQVAVQDFADRIEVTLEHHGEALPSAGLETFTQLQGDEPGDLSGLILLSRVDRVQYQTDGGTSRMTLVKYLQPAARKS